jgi:hypothetical protein
MTYSTSGGHLILVTTPRSGQKKILDEVAVACKEDPKIQLDLTFLLRNAETLYPSVIDGQPSKTPTPAQMVRAKEAAQAIIDRFGPGTRNPYS